MEKFELKKKDYYNACSMATFIKGDTKSLTDLYDSFAELLARKIFKSRESVLISIDEIAEIGGRTISIIQNSEEVTLKGMLLADYVALVMSIVVED